MADPDAPPANTTPFGVIGTVAGNNHYSKHTDFTTRACLANEFTIHEPGVLGCDDPGPEHMT